MQRVLSQVQKNCAAAAPAIGVLTPEDEALLAQARALLPALRAAMEKCELHQALAQLWAVSDAANLYIDQQAPWTLKKTDLVRMATVLGVLVETIRILGILVQPVMPDAGAKILDQLAISTDARDFAAIASGPIAAGTPLPAPQGVFPRIEADRPDAAGGNTVPAGRHIHAKAVIDSTTGETVLEVVKKHENKTKKKNNVVVTIKE
jgi:methionyl-tRNA synthetase